MTENTVPNITQTMSVMAALGLHVHVRVDPERTTKRFTIILGGRRLCDTDAPDKELYNYFHKNLSGALKTYATKE